MRLNWFLKYACMFTAFDIMNDGDGLSTLQVYKATIKEQNSSSIVTSISYVNPKWFSWVYNYIDITISQKG